MERQLTADEIKVVEIMTSKEPTIGLQPTVPIRALASALGKSEQEVAGMADDLWRGGFVGSQSDVLDGRDDPANHKWIWVRGPMKA